MVAIAIDAPLGVWTISGWGCFVFGAQLAHGPVVLTVVGPRTMCASSEILSASMERVPNVPTVGAAWDTATAIPEKGGRTCSSIDHDVVAYDVSGDA